MATFGKTIRTGMAAALLLAGITTGVQGQVSGGGLRIGVLWRARRHLWQLQRDRRHRRRSAFCLCFGDNSLCAVPLKRSGGQNGVHHWIYGPVMRAPLDIFSIRSFSLQVTSYQWGQE